MASLSMTTKSHFQACARSAKAVQLNEVDYKLKLWHTHSNSGTPSSSAKDTAIFCCPNSISISKM